MTVTPGKGWLFSSTTLPVTVLPRWARAKVPDPATRRRRTAAIAALILERQDAVRILSCIFIQEKVKWYMIV
jgi:hypothetical protein